MAALNDESNFNIDLNGDSKIGANYFTVNTAGSVAFQKDLGAGLYAVSINSGDPIAITAADDTQLYDGIYSGWKTLAAATINGTNSLLWKHSATNSLYTWSLDDDWNFVSVEGGHDTTSVAALNDESNFNIDLNGDNVIGALTTKESEGSVDLITGSNGLAFVKESNGKIQAITSPEVGQVGDNILADVSVVAAENINGQNQYVVKDSASSELIVISADINWAGFSSEPLAYNSSDYLAAESNFGVDFNENGTIGI